jgi:hypothetical protein
VYDGLDELKRFGIPDPNHFKARLFTSVLDPSNAFVSPGRNLCYHIIWDLEAKLRLTVFAARGFHANFQFELSGASTASTPARLC